MPSNRLPLLIVATALLLASPLRAIVTDPELDFIKTPVDVAAEYGISKKNEIIRLELDLTGDGQPTVFLTYKGTGSRGGSVWTAYSPTSGGYLRADGLQFREDIVRAGKVDGLNPGGGLLALYPGKGVGNLVRYKIEGGKAIQEEVQKLDYSNPDHKRLFERVFGRKLGEPIPDEFFKNQPHQVLEVKDIEARETSVPRNDASETKPTASTSSERTILSTSWIIIVVMGLVAIGLLCFLLNNRK